MIVHQKNPDRNHYRVGPRHAGYQRARFGEFRVSAFYQFISVLMTQSLQSHQNSDFNANISAPVPEHLKRRVMVSYADLDAPAWSPEKPKKLDYGFGKEDAAMEVV